MSSSLIPVAFLDKAVFLRLGGAMARGACASSSGDLYREDAPFPYSQESASIVPSVKSMRLASPRVRSVAQRGTLRVVGHDKVWFQLLEKFLNMRHRWGLLLDPLARRGRDSQAK